MSLPLRRAARAAAILLWAGLSALAGESAPKFHIDKWGAPEGLPDNEVVALARGQDGYLWLGTLNGLARFDGVQFKVFDEHNTPGLTSGQIVNLFEDNQTNLWISTRGAGTLRLGQGAINDLNLGATSKVRGICQDHAGAVWLLTDDGELRRYTGNKQDGEWPVSQAQSLVAEKSGQIWLGTDAGLVAVDPATVKAGVPLATTTMAASIQVERLLASRTGGAWLLGRDGMDDMIEKRLPGDRLERNLGRYPWPAGAQVTAACEDLDGDLVVGTRGYGVWWFDGEDKVIPISRTNGLSSDYVLSLLVDDAGGLWVGLDTGGLNRVQRQLFDSPPANFTVQSVCQDKRGRLWYSSTRDGIDYLQDDTNATAKVRFGEMRLFDPRALLVDREQNVWAATLSAGLFRWQEAESLFEPAPGIDTPGQSLSRHITALHEDRQGRLWAGTQEGLAVWDGQSWRTYHTNDGLSAEAVQAIVDDASGDIWAGTDGGGLDCLKDGKFAAPLRRAGGFPSDHITALYVDSENTVWIGTAGSGLVRLRNGQGKQFTTDDGLSGNAIVYILEDDEGFLWLGSNAGLMRIKKSALNDYAGEKLDFLPCRTYTERDGLPSSECTLGSQPAASRGNDGVFWFPTIGGLASVAPAQIREGTNAPPLLIESVLVDGQEQNASGPQSPRLNEITIPPGHESLDIQYTCLNLNDPQQARFRYRLEGQESGWVSAGKRRQAHYSKLPPGQYQFAVTARNEDGGWNPNASTLSVTVLPAFWQKGSFRGGVVALFLGLTGAAVYFFANQKFQRQLEGMRQQQALEKDRARIARDIHDQVGASLTQLSLLGEMVESDKDQPAEVAEHAAQITATARNMAHALDEIVWTVNPSNDTLEGLLNYICKNAQEYLAVAGVRYRLDAPAQLPHAEISPEARHNVFLAAKESVTNVVKHARATEAVLRWRVGARSFTLEIEDNGRGPGDVSSPAAQLRNGVRNMRKRMEDIGGTFEIVAGAKTGTIVRLTAPIELKT